MLFPLFIPYHSITFKACELKLIEIFHLIPGNLPFAEWLGTTIGTAVASAEPLLDMGGAEKFVTLAALLRLAEYFVA